MKTSTINSLYNTLTNDPNAMAHLCLTKTTEARVDFLVLMGKTLGRHITKNDALRFFMSPAGAQANVPQQTTAGLLVA